jgi:transposase-like protein
MDKCVDISLDLCYIKDMECPNCLNNNKKMIQRYGRARNGSQRYRCVKCHKTFTLKEPPSCYYCFKCKSRVIRLVKYVQGKQGYIGKPKYKCENQHCGRMFFVDKDKALKRLPFTCPKCHYQGKGFWLAGYDAGRQRYKCKKCKKKFIAEEDKVKRQENEISTKQIELVLNVMFGENLSIRQTAKAINMPFSFVRKLFFAACDAEIKEAINSKNLSETVRRKYAEIFKMNRADVLDHLKQRGFKCAKSQLKKDKDKLEKLKRLESYYKDY